MRALLERLDAWRQARRWHAKRAQMFADADLLIVSHTKSGRTWLRVMLSHLWHLRDGIPAGELVRGDSFKRLNRAIPSVHFARDTLFPAETGRLTIGTRQKMLVLVRDPRDVAVSFWFHVRKRATDAELERKDIDLAARSMELVPFVMDEKLGVPRVISFYNRWAKELAGRPNAARVRYEDLQLDAVGELGRICRFIGQEFTPEQIQEAVRFASFENLKAMERGGFFASGRLGAAGAGDDPGSYKVREGRVGAWRERFTPEQAAVLDEMVAQRLDPAYGYGR